MALGPVVARTARIRTGPRPVRSTAQLAIRSLSASRLTGRPRR